MRLASLTHCPQPRSHGLGSSPGKMRVVSAGQELWALVRAPGQGNELLRVGSRAAHSSAPLQATGLGVWLPPSPPGAWPGAMCGLPELSRCPAADLPVEPEGQRPDGHGLHRHPALHPPDDQRQELHPGRRRHEEHLAAALPGGEQDPLACQPGATGHGVLGGACPTQDRQQSLAWVPRYPPAAPWGWGFCAWCPSAPVTPPSPPGCQAAGGVQRGLHGGQQPAGLPGYVVRPGPKHPGYCVVSGGT